MFVRLKWADKAHQIEENHAEPSFKDLVDLVRVRAEVANSTYAVQPKNAEPSKHQGGQRRDKPKRSAFATQADGSTSDKPQKSCPICSEQHSVMKCEFFNKKSLKERASIAQEKQHCYNCLGPHRKSDCPSKFRVANVMGGTTLSSTRTQPRTSRNLRRQHLAWYLLP